MSSAFLTGAGVAGLSMIAGLSGPIGIGLAGLAGALLNNDDDD